MHSQPQVFISFAGRDGGAFAEAVRLRLARESPAHRVWRDLVSLEGGLTLWDQIQQALDQVRFLVLVVTPGALQPNLAAVVQKEICYARQRGVWIYPVAGAPKDQIPLHKFPPGLEKLTRTCFFDFGPAWPSPWDRASCDHDYQFKHQWHRFLRHLDRPGRPPWVRNTAPADLPRNYVRRQAEYDQLRTRLLQPGRKAPIAIATSLHGAGGFGKTTLAKDLCADPKIEEAFDDGILWVTLGETPDVREALANLYEELMVETAGFSDEEQAVQRLRPMLEDRNLLIVIDDVCSVDHIKRFLQLGDRATLLFTTRHMQVAAEVQRLEGGGLGQSQACLPWIVVDEPEPELALEMLLRGLPERPAPKEIEPYCDLAIRRLGRWPLLIDLVAAELRLKMSSGAAPQRALAIINSGLDHEGLTAFEPADDPAGTACRRERAATLTINASLKCLGEADRGRYLALAIFPEHRSVPCSTLRALWGLSPFETEQLAENLARRALLNYDSVTQSIRLHDVCRAYLLGKLQKPAELHGRLIDGWGDLYRLPDCYAWRHVGQHLIESDRADRLRELLSDYAWLRAKFRAIDAIALRDDAARLAGDQDLRSLARALEQSGQVLARDPSALRGQLYRRLMEIESVWIERLLGQICGAADEGPWLRPLHPGLSPADTALVRVLEGHAGEVSAVAVTPDGRAALSGSHDGTLRLWMPYVVDHIRALLWRSSLCGGHLVSWTFTPVCRSGHHIILKTTRSWCRSPCLFGSLVGTSWGTAMVHGDRSTRGSLRTSADHQFSSRPLLANSRKGTINRDSNFGTRAKEHTHA
jgi:NB-ARC domain/TIR domain/WD domain, G-beta repeat